MSKYRFAGKMGFLLLITVFLLTSACRKNAIERATPVGGSAQKLSAGASATISQYYLYLPKDYYSSTKTYPVIIFLHGGTQLQSGDINSLTQVGVPLHALSTGDFPFIVIAPLLMQPAATWSIADLDKMYGEVINRYRTDKSRVNLSGFSLGGTTAWVWASSHADLFASINPIGGSTDPNPCNLVNVPVWAFHNRQDPIYSFDNLQTTIDRFRACGGNAQLTVYEDGGHEAWTKAYQDQALYDWIYQQQKK